MTASLGELLRPAQIRVPLLATTRQGAIEELVDLVAASGEIPDPAALKRTVWEREQLRSTGIGEGLAIPHGKCAGAHGLLLAMGTARQPIEFESIDAKPVRLVALLVSPPERITDHIQALGRLSRLMSVASFRERAYSSRDAAELYSLLRDADLATVA